MEKYKLVEKIRNAILNGERVLIIGDGILELPEGQGGGTYTQQYTYASLKAKELVY